MWTGIQLCNQNSLGQLQSLECNIYTQENSWVERLNKIINFDTFLLGLRFHSKEKGFDYTCMRQANNYLAIAVITCFIKMISMFKIPTNMRLINSITYMQMPHDNLHLMSFIATQRCLTNQPTRIAWPPKTFCCQKQLHPG